MKRKSIERWEVAIVGLLMLGVPMHAENKVVLLHTNDTHSQIDPTDKDMGGILRRKVVIDSIRSEHENVLLLDAGDAVQGTLYFTIYGGEVEMKMMNELGYDVAILGNHDFDNGMEQLGRNLAQSETAWLSTNYDTTGTPIEGMLGRYKIYDYNGKKLAIIALNLNPRGMISENNYAGLHYHDAIKAANSTAWHLKHNEGVAAVVAITHLGYQGSEPNDVELAESSENIDVIMGGHSHTLIAPGSGKEWIRNADGKDVLITQNGKAGGAIAEITIDLDSIGHKAPLYNQIMIDSRLDNRLSEEQQARFEELLAPYRKSVNELMNKKIGRSTKELKAGSNELLNFISDFIKERGEELVADRHVDLSIANKGSIRRGLPKGAITQGEIISMQPFDNRIVVIELRGEKLIEALEVMAQRDGDGLSKGMEVVYDSDNKEIERATLNGKLIEKDKIYRIATIDYLANGGDYMTPLKDGNLIGRSDTIVYNDLISQIIARKNKPINPSGEARMHPKKE